MRDLAVVSAVASLLWVIGCSHPPQAASSAERTAPKSSEKAQSDLPEEAAQHSSPGEASAEAEQRDGLGESVTLRRCIELALLNNPEIRSAKLLASAMRHRVKQASALDDPMVMGVIATEGMGRDNMVGLSQKIPFPGKLSLRGQAALEDARAAERLAAGVEQRVLADVKKTYYGIYVAHKAIQVNRQNQKVLESLAKLAQVKYETGQGTKQDSLRAQVALSKLRDQLIRFEQEIETAEAKLNMLLSRPITAGIGTPADFDLAGLDIRIGELLELASESRPELLALAHVIRREKANKDLAILNFFPDPSVGFNYMTNERIWQVTLSSNVPIWYDKLSEGVREAKALLAKSVADYEQMKNVTFFEVKDAVVRTKTSESLARLFRDTIIPQAKETLEASQSSYEVGKVDFLTVLDNWQGLLDFELEYYRAEASLEQNFAELERAIGAELGPQARTEPEKEPKQ